MGFRAVSCHVRVPSKSAFAFVLRCFEYRRGVRILEKYVGTAVDQTGGSFSFFGWVEPFIDPHHFGFDFGVAGLRAQGKAIDVANNFWNWDRCHNT